MQRRYRVRWLDAILCCTVAIGCGRTNADKQAAPKVDKVAAAGVEVKSPTPAPTTSSTGAAIPFAEAVTFDPPESQERPPDKTVAGKNTATMFQAIKGKPGSPGLWDQVFFGSADGKPIHYSAEIKTDVGVIKIKLLSDEAPNHVRNFIALSRAGYYDGLPFFRTVRQKLENGAEYEDIESGCPLGTGDIRSGSIGYWLKPEARGLLTHEVGSVGALHIYEKEASACKFYINLTKAPWMDTGYTIFGKVTDGLDIVRDINTRPVLDDEFKDRPREPVLIRHVDIVTTTSK